MITDKTISSLSEMLEKKEISSREICQAYLKRISDLNGRLNAYITVDPGMLMVEAGISDERRSSGKQLSRYDGIPIAVKDNISTKGVKTTCASRILSNFVPPYDAHSYEQMKSRGFLLLGKTNMDEFAMGSTTETSYFGPSKNPFNTDRVPGGSSGGSAVAVSSGMAPGALGSDTGGSIRQPAAFCGVVGIKPTYGRVSRYGLVAYASSLDQIGAFATTVGDAAVLLSTISGHDVRDTTSIDREVDFRPGDLSGDVSGVRIGVPEEYFEGVSEEIAAVIKNKISLLEKSGAVVEKISLKYTEYAIPVYYLIATAEASSNLARYDGVRYGLRPEGINNLSDLYLKSRSEGFGREVKRRIILGTFSLSSGYYDAYYMKALKGRTLIIRDFQDAFSKVDAIISPVTTTTAFKIGEMISDPLQMYMSDILTISTNLAGIPGISVPVGVDGKGMPIGLQIMGDHFREKTILSLAANVEKTCEKIKPEI
ncbi:MAG: Asp-tRNA(Asn)/Glu-tRNA(Gln) amidotransferase subunit GatA [Spirochaetes bacterium]|jgi:aspartyl-tRNA(Asn)/glutamyl-tRNA(Gln) amidotransferase subunit A|nr:Asp-tRNA(Asn)/Glu-tRNA(Gln) amidotransferase subunit GatA [Spirochaetota bacterium]